MPSSTTKRIIDSDALLVTDDKDGPGPFRFHDIGTKTAVTVTVTKEPDGKYWVTDVEMS